MGSIELLSLVAFLFSLVLILLGILLVVVEKPNNIDRCNMPNILPPPKKKNVYKLGE